VAVCLWKETLAFERVAYGDTSARQEKKTEYRRVTNEYGWTNIAELCLKLKLKLQICPRHTRMRTKEFQGFARLVQIY
jgi:hypothetical protein